MIRLSNYRYSLIKIKDLINNYQTLDYKKNINSDKIQNLNNKVIFKFDPVVPIYFGMYNNNRYIIDGIHRLEVYKNYKYLFEEKIPIVEITISHLDELKKYNVLINGK